MLHPSPIPSAEVPFTEAPSADASGIAIDIFTSRAEVPFAGHPTIGTANYLFRNGSAVKTLLTKAGRVEISYKPGEWNGEGMAELSLPHDFHIHAKTWEDEAGGNMKGELISIVKGMSFFMVECRDLEVLEKQGVSNVVGQSGTFSSTQLLDERWREGLIGTYYFTVLDDGETGGVVKVRSRMWGSREDPATGSASSGFACWWALRQKSREVRFEVTQGVEMGRKSEIGVVVRKTESGDGIEEVKLSGGAVQVMEGTIEVE